MKSGVETVSKKVWWAVSNALLAGERQVQRVGLWFLTIKISDFSQELIWWTNEELRNRLVIPQEEIGSSAWAQGSALLLIPAP